MRALWLKMFGIPQSSNRYADTPASTWLILLLLLPFTIVVILFTLMPLFLTIFSSLKESTGFRYNDYKLGFNNFVRIWHDVNFQIALGNTLLYSAIAVPLTIIIALFIAVAITQVANKWARGFWQTIFFLPYVTNTVAISLAIAYLFYPNGIVNAIFGSNIDWMRQGLTAPGQQVGTRWTTFFVVTFSGIWTTLAFNVLILVTAILSVEANLYRAASVDGASSIRQFFSITLPGIYSNIMFLVTYGVIHALKFFPLGLFDNSPVKAITTQGLTLMILLLLFTSQGNFSYAGATTIFIFLISICMTFFVRVLLSGLTNYYANRRLLREIRSSSRLLSGPTVNNFTLTLATRQDRMRRYAWWVMGIGATLTLMLLICIPMFSGGS